MGEVHSVGGVSESDLVLRIDIPLGCSTCSAIANCVRTSWLQANKQQLVDFQG